MYIHIYISYDTSAKPCTKFVTFNAQMYKCTVNNGNIARKFLPRGKRKKKAQSIP